MKRAPPALRLVRATTGASAKEPRAPFGLPGFESDAAGMAIEVVRDEPLAELIRRLPDAATLEAGTMVIVLGGAGRGLLAKVFGGGQPVERSLRATALLTRGYREIEAWVDAPSGEDLVVGLA